MSLSQTSWHNFAAWALENENLRIVIVPQLGGKLASVFDKRTRREWLVGPTLRPLRPASYGARFVDYDVSGWDEMFPTIDACEVMVNGQSVSLPDHGELWSIPWTREPGSPNELKLSAQGKGFPYCLSRNAKLSAPDTLLFEYEITNPGNGPLPYLWAAHPLFSGHPDTTMIFPASVKEVFVVFGGKQWSAAPKSRDTWPNSSAAGGTLHRLDRVGPVDLHDCRKFYAAPETPISWAGMRDESTGNWLRLDWSVDRVPYLGIWIDEGTYCTEPVMALEPATGFYDSLAIASELGKHSLLPPQSSHRWQVSIRLGTGDFPA